MTNGQFGGAVMKKCGEFIGKHIVKHKVFVVIMSLLLLIPSVYGMMTTNVNYDILTYLPKDIETIKG